MLQTQLFQYISDQSGLPTDRIGIDTPIFSAGLLDSMAVIDFTLFLEREAGIRVPASDVSLDNLDTVAKVLAYVARRSATGTS